MLLEEVGIFMSIIQGIINSLFQVCGDLFTIACFFFVAWIILAALKAAAFRHGG